MSGEIGQFADQLSDAAATVGAVDTARVTGDFGATLSEQKQALQATLEEFSGSLHDLQASADEHTKSEETFVATAPTLADVEKAAQELLLLQSSSPTVQGGPVTMLPTALDVIHLEAVTAAQNKYSQLSQERREAVRVFLDSQTQLADKINATAIPATEAGRDQDGKVIPSGVPQSGASSSPSAGGSSPSVGGSSPSAGGSSRTSDSPSDSAGTGAGRPSVDDIVAAGTPVGAVAAAPMMFPQAGMLNQTPMTGRYGPQVVPGYALPGTATSAAQPTTMSDRDFNSLLDRLKSDRAGSSTSLPSSPSAAGSGSGGGVSSGASSPVAARIVQPTSWSNASSPTGVSEAQNARSSVASAPSTAASSTPTSRSGGMPMAPMAPMGGNSAAAPKDTKDQPQILNADPDVYGDDVQTLDPIIDNQKGRFA